MRVLIYLVALVVFIPFTTKAISDPNPPVFRYPPPCTPPTSPPWCLVSLALSIAGPVAWAHRHRRRAADLSRSPGALLVAAMFLISIPVAYRFGPGNAKWCWLALVVLGPLSGSRSSCAPAASYREAVVIVLVRRVFAR